MAAWWSAVSVILVGVFLVSVLSVDRPRHSGVRVVDRARLASEIVNRAKKLKANDPVCKRNPRDKRCPPKPKEKKDKSNEKEKDKDKKDSREKDGNKPTKKPTNKDICPKKYRSNRACQRACNSGIGKPWCKLVCNLPGFKTKPMCHPKRVKDFDQTVSPHDQEKEVHQNPYSHRTPAAPWHSKYTAKTRRLGASGWLKCMQKGRCRDDRHCSAKSGKEVRHVKCRYCSWIFHICTEMPKHKGQDGQRCREGRYCAGGGFCDMSKARKKANGRLYGFCTDERPTDPTEIPIEVQTVYGGSYLINALDLDMRLGGTRRPPLKYQSNDQIGDHVNEGKRKGSYGVLAPAEQVASSAEFLLADEKGSGPQNRKAAPPREINFFSNGLVAIPNKELEDLFYKRRFLEHVPGEDRNVVRPKVGYAEKIRKAFGRNLKGGRYRWIQIDDVNTWDSNLRMPDGNGEVNDIRPFQPGGRVKLGEGLKVFQARLNKPPHDKVHPKKKFILVLPP